MFKQNHTFLVRLGGLILSVTNLYRLYHVEKKKVSHGVAEKSFKKSKRKDFYPVLSFELLACCKYSSVVNYDSSHLVSYV